MRMPSSIHASSLVTSPQSQNRRLSRPDLAKSSASGPNEPPEHMTFAKVVRHEISVDMIDSLNDRLQNSDPRISARENRGNSARTLEGSRRQMEETLVCRQAQHRRKSLALEREPTTMPPESLQGEDSKASPCSLSGTASPDPHLVALYTGSSSSGNTIRASGVERIPDDDVPQTPSYPFPIMSSPVSSLPPRKAWDHGIALNQDPFNLKFPSDKLKSRTERATLSTEVQSITQRPIEPQNGFLPSGASTVADEPSYPSPNLYDVTLKLNSDPGLDAWWANVVEVLQAHYGAQRVSLAVPGDVTDLENVPWGQKATFNTDNDSHMDGDMSGAEPVKETDHREDIAPHLDLRSGIRMGLMSSAKRPSLLSRHSFAGFGKDKIPELCGSDRPQFSRTRSTRESAGGERKALGEKKSMQERIEPLPSTPLQDTAKDSSPMSVRIPSESPAHKSSLAVFPVPRALETEPDPLIKRTGIANLFGRTKPAVLTREYSYNPAVSRFGLPEATDAQSPDDKHQVTPTFNPPRDTEMPAPPSTRSASSLPSNLNTVSFQLKKDSHHSDRRRTALIVQGDDVHLRYGPSLEFYEEYEQTPPSPWSQSPAPSPAPRIYPDQNPFFANHTVDESAFSKHPPPHNYAHVHPLTAIGVDRSRSVVHVPLLHATSSRQAASETLRFPVAIVSFLSLVVPYPSNLRASLTYLTPHLTTSFCLAQQYSQLEKQVAAGPDLPRYGRLLGLGGTFSDESSELELVAGLSGQVNYGFTDDNLSARPSIPSPDGDSNVLRPSPLFPTFGTPGQDANRFGAASEPSATPTSARQGNDVADGYFTLQQLKGSGGYTLQNKARAFKTKQNSLSSAPSSPSVLKNKYSRDDEVAGKDLTAIESPWSAQESRPSLTSLHLRASPRNASTASLIAQIQRDYSRPFSDAIAQLMLNSVPLHLFLAKPQSGEVIWTNTKFDAYRRSQPQEPRVRDPWQNIHPSELANITKEWTRALRIGSQFTERVRVKRYNDDSAYRWFIFRANPLLSATGELLYWIGSFLDIHEQHIAELKAAQEREIFATDAKYRALANSIPQVVFEAAENHGIISANEQWYLYTGQTIEEGMNFGFTKHVHRDDLERCGMFPSELFDPVPSQPAASGCDLFPEINMSPTRSRAACKLFNRGLTPALDALVSRGVVIAQKDENGRVFYSTEIRIRSKGGDYRWHLVRLVKVETNSFGNGEASWYGTCTDINDRKLLERELNKAMQKLNTEMESKTKFFSNMSHEIRTPLNGILGTIPFILDTQLDGDQRRMLDTIQNSSTNLRELVDNILDVSRVEAGKMNLVNSWFHVRSVVEDVIDTVSSRAIDKGLELNYLMDVDVPPMVIGDRFRIRQVLINLMGNAVKFTTQGEIYTRCSVYHDPCLVLKPTELLLNFEVVDTGKGFSATDAERLMQRFTQIGGNSSQQHAGSGLGLFLSKQLVEMHGGKLTPSGREGQGANFSFYVKADSSPPQNAEDRLSTRHPSESFEPSATPLTPVSTVQDPSLDHGLTRVYLPLVESSSCSGPCTRSGSIHRSERSPLSSEFSTPEFRSLDTTFKLDASLRTLPIPEEPSYGDKPSIVTSTNEGATRLSIRSTPKPGGTFKLDLSKANEICVPLHPALYSILILCPLDHAREAIKQHIEQVIPLEVPSTVSSVADVEDWRDLMHARHDPIITHLVLNLQSADDVLDVMHGILQIAYKPKPSLVIISDLYQKRQIVSTAEELISAGIRVHMVPKPVKPSAFSSIFDPHNRRDLSKDRNQDTAREVSNNFKTMSKMVKEVVGNKGYRILLVEDDETNRMVMLKYLDKIKVFSETAGNGQECVEMVFSKEPGYYSLIICDIQMPIKNGYDTCREIRTWEQKNHFPQIPIMALSANAMTDQIDDAARAGFNEYLTKPIKHNELGKMMMGLLDHNKPQILLRDRRPRIFG